ncbi:MAG: hypothetical protein LBF44_00065 [Holosporaceae bacterium]|jgi:hypothetical protein|nr:hypothetical protein [Holosporaceae bacterium]
MTDISEKKEEPEGQNRDKTSGFDKLKENWPSPFVSRSKIAEFTQGMFQPDSLNTLDAKGNGIIPRYARGAKIFYEVDSVISWLGTKCRNKKKGTV